MAHKPIDFAELRRTIAQGGSRRFWSSLEELIDEEGFRQWLEGEFPAAAAAFAEPGRRQFLKLMGASLLLGGLTACSDSASSDRALPYVTAPEALVPGVPRYYASAVVLDGYAQPVLATTYDGRPTKLDGNPEHPATRGKSDPFMQSAVLDLYDPERAKNPTRDGNPMTWSQVERQFAAWRERWDQNGGAGLRLLTGPTSSPTLVRQFTALLARWPNARLSIFDPLDMPARAQAMRAAFGRVLEPRYRLEASEVIVSLDEDLLGPGPHQVVHARGWAERRGEAPPGSGRGRLHIAESIPSLTGTVASTRLSGDAARLGELARALGAALAVEGWQAPQLAEREQSWVDRAARELRRYAGRSLLCVGAHLPAEWQALAPIVNERLGNVGATVDYVEPLRFQPEQAVGLPALVEEMAAGSVATLIVLDANPAYAAAAELGFAALMPRVSERLHAGLHADETAALAQWHLPLTHALESWGDGLAVDGTASVMQPVLRPLYATRSMPQILDMLAGETDPAPDAAVLATWRTRFGDAFAERWRQSLHDGFVADSASAAVAAKVQSVPPAPAAAASASQGIEITFRPDPCIRDGRFGNVAWLQELPKPLTKITWDNVVAVSPALAEQQGLSNGDRVEIAVGERTVRGPAWIVPGQAAGTVALFLGYGRRAGGDIAKNVGYDAQAVRPAQTPWLARGTLRRLGGDRAEIATTQAHHRMDGFEFVREVTVKEPKTKPPKEMHTLYPEWGDPDYAWGMVIDLDRCIGCNACVSACNVENNVLIVGKEQVAMGREMLWLRIDRYYTGEVDNPRSYFQPVPCMHCEKAPCEMGCPVNATVHSADGLNQMVYNRCIGTRTCSSYCPYKVRRFNWYDYRKLGEPAERAAKNPDVTVRSRGVMEKCTYCTQRIQAARVAADKEQRPIGAGEVVTACQQACPTQAIAFGNLKDADGEVARRRQSGRHYVLLEEVGTRPRTTYLARWNDDPEAGGEAA